MDDKKAIQKKIDFIASEIRAHRSQLHKLNKELQEAVEEQQKLKVK